MIHVKGLPLTTEWRIVVLAMEETIFRWEAAEVISNKPSQTTDKLLTVTAGGLESESEFNMSRIVAQVFGLDRPCGKMFVMANGREISGLDRQKSLVDEVH
jgi:hypothetical protein